MYQLPKCNRPIVFLLHVPSMQSHYPQAKSNIFSKCKGTQSLLVHFTSFNILTMNRYFSFYHPSLPILSQPTSADDLYNSSALLFWTVMTTAARHDSPDFLLFPKLVPVIKRRLWMTIAEPPHTISSLQAMAIFCVWPLPCSSMPLDITVILAGILKSAAMHVGLHRPDILRDYSRAPHSITGEALREVIKVWCCTYIAVER